MRRSRRLTGSAVLLAAFAAWSCSTSTTPIPTLPTPVYVTDTFSGTLSMNGAITFPFGTSTAGTVTATLTSLGPDSPLLVGVAVGTWSGSVCSIVLPNDQAAQGAVVTASASSAGSFCVRIYDAGARLTKPLPFVLTVVHP
jgi:ABC-type nitrate/sulfonate/bicarbonate transport system permease component